MDRPLDPGNLVSSEREVRAGTELIGKQFSAKPGPITETAPWKAGLLGAATFGNDFLLELALIGRGLTALTEGVANRHPL